MSVDRFFQIAVALSGLSIFLLSWALFSRKAASCVAASFCQAKSTMSPLGPSPAIKAEFCRD